LNNTKENPTVNTSPPNLRKLFGDQYQITHDPAAQSRKEMADPWMMTLKCTRGVIYPFGENTLALELDYHPRVAKRVAQIPGVCLHQDGGHEKTFTFPVDVFSQVAEVVRPHKRPGQSPVKNKNLIPAARIRA
jgi:hypothetical protein